ncbi:MAG: hypothetical protein ACXW4B_05535 [Micavibrio sp.]
MKAALTLLTLLGVSVFSAPGLACEDHAAAKTADDFFVLAAAEEAVDEFGHYFTAAAPDALTDNGDEFSAEALGNIEPAAGGESVFILPESTQSLPEAPLTTEDGRLAAPENPLVPGMETQP